MTYSKVRWIAAGTARRPSPSLTRPINAGAHGMAPLQPSSAVAGCLRDTDPRAVAGVALSTQRESVVLWETATGRPVAPLVGRQDQRGTDRADRLVRAGADEEISRRTGLPLDPMFSALKMAALLDAHDTARTRSRTGALRLGTVDAYLLHTLTGSPLTEIGNASRTQLLDLATGDLDDELLALFDVPRAALSRIVPSTGPFPALRGLPPLTDGTPLLAVLGDSHAALFAHAGWRPGTGVRAVRRAGRQYRTARPARAGTRDGGRRAGLVPAHPGPRGNRQPRPLAAAAPLRQRHHRPGPAAAEGTWRGRRHVRPVLRRRRRPGRRALQRPSRRHRPRPLRAVERRIGVAGGTDRSAAIRGAARGRWINILITDVEVARDLLDD
ncbi:hypothetical protein KVH28_00900 [Streptomyces olivaceus]|nr:hypothetical protein [Streptomyces olivaceus]